MTENNQNQDDQLIVDDEKYLDLDYLAFDEIPELVAVPHALELLTGITDYGFTRPSLIQSKAIPIIADGNDLLAQSRSGTGKTGAFVIGMLTRIDPELCFPQSMIIANSRNLAEQIYDVTSNISEKMNLKITLCTGGIDDGRNRSNTNYREALNSHILIGCPGRINDLLDRSNYKIRTKDGGEQDRWKLTETLKVIIIDEADEMLREGFQEDITRILQRIKDSTQLCTFSATYNSAVAKNYLKIMKKNHAIKLLIDDNDVKIDSIKNYVLNVQKEDNKFTTLIDLFSHITICQLVIFVNRVDKAKALAKALIDDGNNVGVMHRELTEKERRDTMKQFRQGNTRILVSTDIIARGIDIQQVGLVINYDIPTTPEQYIHRVGRSGRFGKTGVAINFVTDGEFDKNNIDEVKKIYAIDMQSSFRISEITKYLSGKDGYNYFPPVEGE